MKASSSGLAGSMAGRGFFLAIAAAHAFPVPPAGRYAGSTNVARLLGVWLLALALLSGCSASDLTATPSGVPTPPPSFDPALYQAVAPGTFVAQPGAYVGKMLVMTGDITDSKQVGDNSWEVDAALTSSAKLISYAPKQPPTAAKRLRVYFTLDGIDPSTNVPGGYRNIWLGGEAMFVGRADSVQLLTAASANPSAGGD